MDNFIEIKNLVVFANHGVFNEEAVMGQRFEISLKLYIDIRKAAETDDISDAVNYGEVCEFVTEYTKSHRCSLIEKAARDIAYAILAEFPLLSGTEVRIEKPWAPIGLPLKCVSVNVSRMRKTAYIGIGSNMGDKKKYLDFAAGKFEENPCCRILAISDYIETKPVGDVEQDDFLNACIEIETVLPPFELLDFANRIENEAGRERKIHWGPRTLDVDILLYGDEMVNSERLTIPHREMAKRGFVLHPLSQIAPYAYHPVRRKYISELLEELENGNA